MRPLPWPAALVDACLDEILSIDLDESRRRVGATCPEAGKVVFWDVRRRELLAVLPMKRPLGIALTKDARYYLVNDIAAGVVQVIDAETLTLAPDAFPAAFVQTAFTQPHALIIPPRA